VLRDLLNEENERKSTLLGKLFQISLPMTRLADYTSYEISHAASCSHLTHNISGL